MDVIITVGPLCGAVGLPPSAVFENDTVEMRGIEPARSMVIAAIARRTRPQYRAK